MAFFRRARFELSAQQLAHLPPDEGREVAFAGRSNAGKSSALNVLCDHHGLARTSKTPGRTQLINFFTLDEERRLVDLPGYGYAKVAAQVRDTWQETLGQYLETRQSLMGLMLIMDARHPLTAYDQQMLAWCAAAQMPVHILLTKADKLNRHAAKTTLMAIQKSLTQETPASVQLFSALAKTGIEEAHAVLANWLAWKE